MGGGAGAFGGIDVGAEPEEDGRAEAAFGGPLEVFAGADELGLGPDGGGEFLGCTAGEGFGAGDQRIELSTDGGHHLLIEAGADVAGPVELIAVIDAENEGSKVGALTGQISAEDELLLVIDLDLDPIAGAGFQIAAIETFGDEAFEALGADGGEEFGDGAGEVFGESNGAAGFDDGLQETLAFFEGLGAEVAAVQVEEVEGEEENGAGAGELGDGSGVGGHDARLQAFERGASFFIESGDLAIEDGGGGVDELRQAREFGIGAIHGGAFAADDANGGVGEIGERADAVPLDLVDPAGSCGRGIGEGSEHGRDAGGHRVNGLGQERGEIVGTRREVVGDLVLGASGGDGVLKLVDVVVGLDGGVLLFDEEPFVLLGGVFETYEREVAFDFLAVETNFEIAARDLVGGGEAFENIEGTDIPEHHGAGAVVAFGDVAFKGGVEEGVVFDHDGEAFDGWVEGGSLGNGPGFEGAVDFDAEVVVEAAGVVTLDAEEVAGGLGGKGGSGFGSEVEFAFARVVFKSHTTGKGRLGEGHN